MKKTRVKRTIFAILILLASPFASGEPSNLPLVWLKTEKFFQLEKYYADIDRRFSDRAISETELIDAYKAFYYLNYDGYSKQFAEWVRLYPDSPFAYLARGTYYRKVGENVRGTNAISDTPNSSIVTMNKMFGLAAADLKHVLALNRKNYFAALQLLDISQYYNDAKSAERYYQLANTNGGVRSFIVHVKIQRELKGSALGDTLGEPA